MLDYVDGKSCCWRCVYNLGRIYERIPANWTVITIMMFKTAF